MAQGVHKNVRKYVHDINTVIERIFLLACKRVSLIKKLGGKARIQLILLEH